jgi:ArsR family transcriptional regulator, arsenate/arsenite/antimonite-responsive transcriptional repressor
MEDPAEYTIDRSTIGSLSSDTRIQILRSLLERRKTNAELGRELSLASPTIHHHLTRLEEAGLIESQEDGHKWVYYRLTPFGMALFNPEKKMKFSIAFSAILTFMVGFAAVVTYLSIPRLQMKPSFPGLDDPFFPLLVVAVVALILQGFILVSSIRRMR